MSDALIYDALIFPEMSDALIFDALISPDVVILKGKSSKDATSKLPLSSDINIFLKGDVFSVPFIIYCALFSRNACAFLGVEVEVGNAKTNTITNTKTAIAELIYLGFFFTYSITFSIFYY